MNPLLRGRSPPLLNMTRYLTCTCSCCALHEHVFRRYPWFLIGETHRGQQVTPALTLPQVRYGLSVLLLEVCCTPGIDSICRQVHDPGIQ